MGWQMAVIGALGAAQYQQQGAYGKFNQKVQERNAEVAQQKKEVLDNKLELDLATLDKNFEKLQGENIVTTAKSGVTQGGTAARIRIANRLEKELEVKKMEYNTAIGKANADEESNMFRIQGQIARMEAKAAQLKTISDTGTSLLKMRG